MAIWTNKDLLNSAQISNIQGNTKNNLLALRDNESTNLKVDGNDTKRD